MEQIIKQSIGAAMDKFAEEKIKELNEKYLREFEEAMISEKNKLILTVIEMLKIERNYDPGEMMVHVHIKLSD